MKTKVHGNSVASYRQMLEDRQISRRELEVLEALQMFGPMTREQIAKKTGMKEGSACGRVADLIDKALVERDGSRENNVTKKANEVIRLVNRATDPQQLELEMA